MPGGAPRARFALTSGQVRASLRPDARAGPATLRRTPPRAAALGGSPKALRNMAAKALGLVAQVQRHVQHPLAARQPFHRRQQPRCWRQRPKVMPVWRRNRRCTVLGSTPIQGPSRPRRPAAPDAARWRGRCAPAGLGRLRQMQRQHRLLAQLVQQQHHQAAVARARLPVQRHFGRRRHQLAQQRRDRQHAALRGQARPRPARQTPCACAARRSCGCRAPPRPAPTRRAWAAPPRCPPRSPPPSRPRSRRAAARR